VNRRAAVRSQVSSFLSSVASHWSNPRGRLPSWPPASSDRARLEIPGWLPRRRPSQPSSRHPRRRRHPRCPADRASVMPTVDKWTLPLSDDLGLLVLRCRSSPRRVLNVIVWALCIGARRCAARKRTSAAPVRPLAERRRRSAWVPQSGGDAQVDERRTEQRGGDDVSVGRSGVPDNQRRDERIRGRAREQPG
jgi:hypothetical protein